METQIADGRPPGAIDLAGEGHYWATRRRTLELAPGEPRLVVVLVWMDHRGDPRVIMPGCVQSDDADLWWFFGGPIPRPATWPDPTRLNRYRRICR